MSREQCRCSREEDWNDQPQDLGIEPPSFGDSEAGAAAAGVPGGAGPRAEEAATTAASDVGPEPFHSPTINLSIEGIEATQGTQFYHSSRHLPPAQVEADNSVPLIERKHLAIRVYPDYDVRISGFPIPGSVDGGVWFRRVDVADTYKQAFRLNAAVPGRRAVSIDRGATNHTLNFRISDLYTVGRIVVYALAWADVSGSRRYSSWFGRIFQFTAVPHVRIRAYGIRYSRGAIVRAAPSLADFTATGVYLRKTYPMSRFNFVSYGTLNFGGDLTDTSGGGCGAGWNALWGLLRNQFFANGQDANVYGLMQGPIPSAYGGCGGGNVGVSFVGGGAVMAQELGHGVGRAHAPGCGAGGPDPNYPAYDGHGSASIGEFGMDYATGQVYNPASSNDFMGYCANPWVSPYTYRALITGIQNQPTPAPAPGATEAAAFRGESLHHEEEHLYLSFRVSCHDEVEILGGYTLKGPASIAQGSSTHYRVEVQDKNGQALYSKTLTLEEAHQDLGHAHTHYFESFPMYSEATQLVFYCDHSKPQVEVIPKTAPTVTVRAPRKTTDKVKLSWTTKDSQSKSVRYMVRYSNDDGGTWLPVAMDLTTTNCEVDFDNLPGGNKCRFEVLASVGLRTGRAQGGAFEVPTKPRQAQIAEVPDPDGTRPAHVVELAGCAYSPDGCAEEETLEWQSSLNGSISTGSHLIANDLVPGEHVITLVAPDGLENGGETRAEIRVRVGARVPGPLD